MEAFALKWKKSRPGQKECGLVNGTQNKKNHGCSDVKTSERACRSSDGGDP